MNFSFLYFSCARDQKLLELSYDSIKKHIPDAKIYVAGDIECFGDIDIIEKRNSKRLLGLENIRGMLEIYAQIAEQSDGSDYLAKIDSDIILANPNIFGRVCGDAFGAKPMLNPANCPPNHFAGACYFLNKNILKKMFDTEFPERVHFWKGMGYPEDMVISLVANCVTQDIYIEKNGVYEDGAYYTDSYLTNISTKSAEDILKYNFIHCRSSYYIMNKIWTTIKNK